MEISNVNSILLNYNNYNILNAMVNPDNSKVPLISSVNNDVKGTSEETKFNNVSPETELQNIYNTLQPNTGFVANINMSNNTNELQLLYGGNSPVDPKVIDVYNSIQNGTFIPSTTSISTSSPYNLYSNINSMMNQLQTTGNLFNATA